MCKLFAWPTLSEHHFCIVLWGRKSTNNKNQPIDRSADLHYFYTKWRCDGSDGVSAGLFCFCLYYSFVLTLICCLFLLLIKDNKDGVFVQQSKTGNRQGSNCFGGGFGCGCCGGGGGFLFCCCLCFLTLYYLFILTFICYLFLLFADGNKDDVFVFVLVALVFLRRRRQWRLRW